MEIAEAAVSFWQREKAKTESALAVLLGENQDKLKLNLDTKLGEQLVQVDIPVGIPSEILRKRPDLMELENQLHAQNAQIGVAVAQLFPSFDLTAMGGMASNDFSTLLNNGGAWLIAGSVTGPIFNFGKNISRIDLEKARTKELLFKYQKATLIAFKEVDDALVSVNTYEKEIEAKKRQVEAAKSAVELATVRYNKGVTSYLEVLETQRALFQSELELSEAERNYLVSFINLYKAIGGEDN